MHHAWTREKRRDESIVYRHDATGCTLQRVRRGPAEDSRQRAGRWLLFTRFYELLEVFERARTDERIPFEEAEQTIDAIPAIEMFERASPGVNFFSTYALIETPE